MVIPDEDIISFQELYKKHFGKEISREDAYEQGIKLLRLMSLVYKPMTEEEFSRIQERRKIPLPIPTE
ncbi:MAG: hypothetical protein A3J47_00205 [Candidatus Yanofskybacteria bacterium RIFCSPHIGHO2_02_FULL_43_22]|uniref:Uncharacterized protein n=1 Tax=Candidatus Yanofskybacteria bacterium RIFCSPHIGHO2_02_FULL_43_22 TaxID=1802681 RepID=A0A1F8FSY8_9BACT|nr:MAG: hypothetical protein A3J47_00205 [Candidatus Yanofskybacteria bacterium RIFCSPHIGHO2_02_FULL_43_22]